jgi:hypothetical protein
MNAPTAFTVVQESFVGIVRFVRIVLRSWGRDTRKCFALRKCDEVRF